MRLRDLCSTAATAVRYTGHLCVTIIRLILIFIRGDEEGLSAAVTAEADRGQLTGEAVWPGRPGAPSDTGGPSGHHTQSSDISESGRVSAVTSNTSGHHILAFYWLPDYYYRLDADTLPQRVKERLDMRMVTMWRMAMVRVTRVTSPTASWRT